MAVKKKKKYDWIKIKNYYIFHTVSLEEIAKKFGVSIGTVKAHCSNENWVELKEKKHTEIVSKIDQKLTESVIDKKTAANARHTELYDKGLEVANKLLDIYLEELKAGKKRTRANAYNLSFIMKAIADAQKGQRTSLNINDNGELENIEPDIKIIDGIDVNKI